MTMPLPAYFYKFFYTQKFIGAYPYVLPGYHDKHNGFHLKDNPLRTIRKSRGLPYSQKKIAADYSSAAIFIVYF